MLANQNGWGLFVMERDHQSGVGTIRRIDLASGDVTEFDEPFVDGLVVLTGSGSHIALTSASDVGGATQMTSGPDDDVWVTDSDASSAPSRRLRLVRPETGGPPRTLGSFDTTSLGFRFLVGSTATGDAVFAGADGTYFAFGLTRRTPKRLATGALVSLFDRGNYSTINCDAAGACHVTIQGGDNAQMTIGYDPGVEVSIAPDGNHALVIRTHSTIRSLEMLDLRAGAPIAGRSGSGGGDNVSISATWTPDSSEAFVLTDRRIIPVRTDGALTPDIQLSDDFRPDDSLVGIA